MFINYLAYTNHLIFHTLLIQLENMQLPWGKTQYCLMNCNKIKRFTRIIVYSWNQFSVRYILFNCLEILPDQSFSLVIYRSYNDRRHIVVSILMLGMTETASLYRCFALLFERLFNECWNRYSSEWIFDDINECEKLCQII